MLPMKQQWKITSNPANLREVRKDVESFAKSAGAPTEAADAIGLVLNEALANVIRHGYDDATDKPIMVTAEEDGRKIELAIRDWAKPFDPSQIKPKCEGELTPGGIGMLCIRRLMDDVKFERLPDGMLLKMTKKLV